MNVQQGPQLSDLSAIVRRRGKVVAAVAGVVVLAMYWIAMALPNQYAAHATILVEPQAIDEQLVRAGVRESDLKERLGIMTAQILSRARLSRLIDELGLYPEESEVMLRQEVIDLMRSHVTVAPVVSELEADKRNTRDIEFNTFKITFRDRSPQTAALVAQSIANDFLDANIKARVEVSQQSLDFMEDSIQSLSERIVQVEGRIKRVKADNAGHLPEDLATNQRILQSTLAQIREARRALDLARSDEAFWANQVIAAVNMTSPNDAMSPANRIKMLETELGMMRSKGYTDRHPDVVQAEHEIELLRTRLEASEGEDDVADSYAEQNAKSEQQRASLRAKNAEEEITRLEEQLHDVEERIAATPAVAEQLEALEREYEHLNKSFQDFSARRQQAAVQANLERKQLGEQFKILEPAFPATRPSSPNRVLILVLGTMMGVGMGVAMGLVLESVDSSAHDSRGLQSNTHLPVLASIPVIMLEPDRAARARRMLREAVIAGAFAVFCLLGGAVTYFFVNGAPGAVTAMIEGGEKEVPAEPAGGPERAGESTRQAREVRG